MREYQPRAGRNKPESKFSEIIILISFLILISFVVVCLMLVAEGVFIPDSLIYGVFGFFGTEMIAVAWRTKPQKETQIKGGVR